MTRRCGRRKWYKYKEVGTAAPPSLFHSEESALVGESREIVQAGAVDVRDAADYLQRNIGRSALVAGIGAAADLQQLRHLPLSQVLFQPQFPDALELHEIPPIVIAKCQYLV